MDLLNYAVKFILPGPCFKSLKVISALNVLLKGIVHPKMKITPWFTHPQAILGVYDLILSNDQSYIKNIKYILI